MLSFSTRRVQQANPQFTEALQKLASGKRAVEDVAGGFDFPGSTP